MKKIYNSPKTYIVKIHSTASIMQVSGFEQQLNREGSDGSAALVKDNQSSSSYNVWDDDWSN